MCLHVLDIPEDLNPKIATEDIPCYKLLQIVPGAFYYITPWQNFRIDFGYKNRCYMAVDEMTGNYYAELISRVRSSRTGNFFRRPLSVSRGLKWINGKNIQPLSRAKVARCESLDVYAGIHAYLNTNIFHNCDQVLFKAIIPKGAHYFIGMHNEIVADKMIIFDESVV